MLIITRSTGAKADLFDISCLAAKNPTAFNNAEITGFTGGATAAGAGALLGRHFFQNVTNVLSPVWDDRGDAAKGNPTAFVRASKIANVAAPTGSQDVPWLALQAVEGSLATTLYRAQTKGGQPPASVRVFG